MRAPQVITARPAGGLAFTRFHIDGRIQIVEKREDGIAGEFRHLYVIVGLEKKSDGRLWMHASVSRKNRKMPTYEDLLKLKQITFGPERTAVQIFPPEERHIDIGTKLPRPVEVLHLWGPYYVRENEGWLPDMADGGESI